MGKVICAFLLLVCGVAQAQFVPAAKGLASAGLKPSLADAVVKVVATNPNGQTMQCSATYVSDQGHLLLASHCLELALFGRPILDPNADQNLLTLEVNDHKGEWRVRLISPCRRPDIVTSNPEEMSLVSILDCDYYDLAILEPIKPQSVPACVSAFQGDEPKELLATVGLPIRTFRLREPNSEGNQPYFSEGRIGASESCRIEVSSTLDRIGVSFSLTEAVAQARVENALQTNLDVVPGSSGGLVIDGETGWPVGVVSFSTAPRGFDVLRERCEEGGSFITALTHLQAAFKAWLPSASWSEFKGGVACQQRRAH